METAKRRRASTVRWSLSQVQRTLSDELSAKSVTYQPVCLLAYLLIAIFIGGNLGGWGRLRK